MYINEHVALKDEGNRKFNMYQVFCSTRHELQQSCKTSSGAAVNEQEKGVKTREMWSG